MFLYRDHRGGLAESMQDAREMADFAELKRHLFRVFGEGKITVEPYGYDSRIQWNTHIVCHNGRGVGYTNAPVNTQEPASVACPLPALVRCRHRNRM